MYHKIEMFIVSDLKKLKTAGSCNFILEDPL